MKKFLLLVLIGLTAQGCLILDDDNCRRSSIDYLYTDTECYWEGDWVRVCDAWDCWDEYDERRVCDTYDVCRDTSRRHRR